mmetsp:Transcript_5408/g.18799  ORF Transcript_5408/g.18799 Transcript_5408/m.18799 type:complete len:728 (-) Transcript_5408:177-2360(-)
MSGPVTLTVANCPSNELALTNCAFCSEADAAGLVPYAELGDAVFLVQPHPAMAPGTVGLNGIQRKYVRVSPGDAVAAHPFQPPAERFSAVLLQLSLEFVRAAGKKATVDARVMASEMQRKFTTQVFTVGQRVAVQMGDVNFAVQVQAVVVDGQAQDENPMRGMLVSKTQFVFEAVDPASIKVVNQKSSMAPNLFKSKEVNFETLGIGGLDKQFTDIFRRAFASRVFPPSVVARLGIKHVKGMLLYGPPGTGKTLIARQIGKMLNGKEPKVVNGPELLNKYVGQSEENMRALFQDAEADQAQHGDDSDLHIIIFDEIDAICKQRGTSGGGAGVNDSMVNQLLTKIDGVDALNNILLIAMTNRKDLLDEALLRPGRLEVMVMVGLPDEAGRMQILKIHTSKMATNEFLSPDVDLDWLAQRTKNFSGAEIEGLVKSATSFALSRQVDISDISAPLDEDNIKVTMADFEEALTEVQPAFGASTDVLERCRINGIIPHGPKLAHLMTTCKALVEQVRVSDKTPLMACLLDGAAGTGKTALAATLALESDFPFVKLLSAESMVGMHEGQKVMQIAKVFDDAYKSPLSILVLDDIERLLEYVNIGPRFSNAVLQALLVLLKRLPPEGHKLLVLGTSSNPGAMEAMGISGAFNVVVNVPALGMEDTKRALQHLDAFEPAELDTAISMLDEEVPIKRLLMLLEVARHSAGGGAEGAEGGRIPLKSFLDCLQELGTV